MSWLTAPIIAGSDCPTVVAHLEALPNNVIPKSTVLCTQSVGNNAEETVGWTALGLYDAQHPQGLPHAYKLTYQMAFWEAFAPLLETDNSVDNSAGQNLNNPADPTEVAATYVYNWGTSTSTGSTSGSNKALSGSIYRLKFTGNPGVFKQPQIETYLDGNTRPSLKSKSGALITKVWTDGQQGEYSDYHADHCDGISATVAFSMAAGVSDSATLRTAYSYLTGMTTAEMNLLKACLGDADGDLTNNIDVYDWDHGSTTYPHLIKLVRSVTTYNDGGYYAALYWDASVSRFKFLNPFLPPDRGVNDQYEIYTTKGTFAKASSTHRAIFSFGSPKIYTMNLAADTTFGGATSLSTDTGDVSCLSGSGSPVCINKGDLITVLSGTYTGFNPPHINLYTVNKVNTEVAWGDVSTFLDPLIAGLAAPNPNGAAKAMTNLIHTDLSLNWGNSFDSQSTFSIYKFTPAPESTYAYVAECSNRGLCNRKSGTCSCFSGYTNDACSVQNSLAL
jgi:EGF-like domain